MYRAYVAAEQNIGAGYRSLMWHFPACLLPLVCNGRVSALELEYVLFRIDVRLQSPIMMQRKVAGYYWIGSWWGVAEGQIKRAGFRQSDWLRKEQVTLQYSSLILPSLLSNTLKFNTAITSCNSLMIRPPFVLQLLLVYFIFVMDAPQG